MQLKPCCFLVILSLSSSTEILIHIQQINCQPDRVTADFYNVREKKILIITEKGYGIDLRICVISSVKSIDIYFIVLPS